MEKTTTTKKAEGKGKVFKKVVMVKFNVFLHAGVCVGDFMWPPWSYSCGSAEAKAKRINEQK